ncbi:hypothetical protein BKA70DRAFT_1435597 [Coprinopsis sp. MPI-PUGE-AT-0042]|nr:hypothetical protein BKA70DRAFT_1435597 [Coprinopsis sp. MPI-PUGE-AT-0042]
MDPDAAPAIAQAPQPGPPSSPFDDAQPIPIEDDDLDQLITSDNDTPSSVTSWVKGSIVATERVLHNQDLVDLIIAHYGDGFEEAERYSCLRKMSELSKIFFESCSDIIWKEMSSLSPLLWLLPQSVVHDSEIIFVRPLKPEDFARWRTYSHRVRSFTIGARKPINPSMHALAMLIASQAATSEVLLPALQQVHCEEKLGAEEMMYLSLLASPSMNGLHLSGSKGACFSPICLESALKHVVEAVPRLSALSIQTIDPLSSLWLILARLPSLQTLDLKVPYAVREVEKFASFASLRQGTLVLYKSYKNKQKIMTNQKVRCSLCIKHDPLSGREVSLTGRLDVLASTTRAVTRHASLKRLEIRCTEKQPKDTYEELLNVVSVSSPSTAQITFIDQGGGGSIPLEALSQLLALDNLQILTVDVVCSIQPTTGGADLVVLILCLAAKYKTTPLTTLRICRLLGERLGLITLKHLCNHLPHLLELEISIDSSLACDPTLPMLTPLPSLTQRHPLQRLYLKDQRSYAFKFKEFRTTAMLVNQFFPELGSLEVTVLTGTEDNGFVKEGWELIDGLRKDYQLLGNTTVLGQGEM